MCMTLTTLQNTIIEIICEQVLVIKMVCSLLQKD